jgi:hypothetical protein
MEGIYKGVDLAVYSYSFSKDLGKVQELFTQTVIQIRNLNNTIPQFTLCPQDQIDAIMINLPTQDGKNRLLETAGIRLTNHPDFRKQYKLMGFESQKLSAMFDNESVISAIQALESKPFQGLICTEGYGLNLLIYPSHKRIPVKHLTDFLDKCIVLGKQIESMADG